MRLLLPGWEGNMNVKCLRRIKLAEEPAMSYYESQNLRADPAERQGVPVLFPAGGEVVHHPAVARAEIEGAGLLRDLRHRLSGERAHRAR